MLEEQLSTVFCLAHHWKAIVLLDGPDVFLQAGQTENNLFYRRGGFQVVSEFMTAS